MTQESRTVGEVVNAYLADQCTVILDAEAALRAGDNVIHPTRVAVRRLRSTLRVFGGLYDQARGERLESELGWWAGVLGAVRDLDVLTERLLVMIAKLPAADVVGPVATAIQAELGGRRAVAYAVVEQELAGERYRDLEAEIAAWRAEAPVSERATAPASKIDRYIKRADRSVERRLAKAVAQARAGEPSDHLFHQARKAGKRHRYAVEAAQSVWGLTAEVVIEARERFQDLLGGHQDSIISGGFLREFGIEQGRIPGHSGFTFGLLYERERAAASRLLDELREFLAT